MENRIIFMGADAAGYALKEEIKEYITKKGYQVFDMGCHSDESCHYPIFANAVCEAVQKCPDTAFGILICGTGIGMSMCANKYKGIRAGLCGDTFSAEMTRKHNNANVLCMGARVIKSKLAKEITDAFLKNDFEGGRHQVRIDMMADYEAKDRGN